MRTAVYVIIMAAVTYAVRALPFTLFRREIKSVWLKSFLYYVPYAVLGAMTFPAIFFSTSSPIAAAIGCAAAILTAFLGGGLMLSAALSVVFVLVCGFII